MHAARSAALVLLVLAIALAGCSTFTTSSDSNDPGGTATATPIPIDTPTPSVTPSPTPHSDPGEPPTKYLSEPSNLGENEQPHGIRISNSRDETTVAATIHITHDDAETIFEETYMLPPGASHSGVLDYKANYTVTVTVGNHTATEHIPKSMFDCNDSTTTFTIIQDNVTLKTVSTSVACPTESPE